MSSCRATNANAWKAAARAWWERLNEARAVNHELSLARDKAENERDVACSQRDNAIVKMGIAEENVRILRKNQEANDAEVARVVRERDALMHRMVSHRDDAWAPLVVRIAEADRKHPRDSNDTHLSAADVESCLYDIRRELKKYSTWAAALECEMWEAVSAAISESPERLADELLDVATVALRWRRAVLERTKTGE